VSFVQKAASRVDKQQFLQRLQLAGGTARAFAASYILDLLPEELCFTISRYDDPSGRRGPPGTIKFLGGRFLKPSDLVRLTARRAAALLWVDGKVPAWINIGVGARLETTTELVLRFCRLLVPADEGQLPPDFGCPPGNPLVPFRIRGPGPPVGWRSVELDGRVPLATDPHSSPEDG
jgi:hypothetical protein